MKEKEIQSSLDVFREATRRSDEMLTAIAANFHKAQEQLSRVKLASHVQQLNQIAEANASNLRALSEYQDQIGEAANQQLDSIQETVAIIKAQEENVKKQAANLRRMSFLYGIGSIVDLWPDPSAYWQILSAKTIAEELGEAWSEVGNHIHRATEVVSGEQQKEED